MFKTLFFILILNICFRAQAQVQATWLTVASVALSDGKTTLLFDPAWTRPTLWNWLGLEPLRSDEKLVTSVLKENNLLGINAVFTSHSHFDHVIDAPLVSKLSNGTFYVDESAERIAKAYKDSAIRTQRLFPKQKIQIGDFTVTPLPRTHSAVLHLFDFLPGPVPEGTELSFWDYRVGETWFYLIEHPRGTILVDQGSESFVQSVEVTNVDVLIQGIANRKNDDVILNGYLKKFGPKKFIPVHFDNFFADFAAGEEGLLLGIRMEELLGKIQKTFPMVEVTSPKYGKPILLF